MGWGHLRCQLIIPWPEKGALGSGCDPTVLILLSVVPGMFGVAGSQQLSDLGMEWARPSHSFWSVSRWHLNTLISIKSLICLLRLVAFRESGTWAWISGVSGICFLKSPLWLRLKRKLPEWMLKLPGWMCYPHDVGCGEKAVARFFKLTDNDCAYLRSTVWLFNTLYISI